MSDNAKPKSETPEMSRSFQRSNVLEEEAEEHLVKVLEERRERASAFDKGWDASVEGERPPLRRLTQEGAEMFISPPSEESRPASKHWFRSLANRHILKLKSQRMLSDDSSDMMGQEKRNPHKEEGFDVQGVFCGVGGEGTTIGQSGFSHADTNTDRLFSAAVVVDETYKQHDETASVASGSEYSEIMDEERLPLTGTDMETHRRWGSISWFAQGSAENARRKRAAGKRRRKRKKKCLKMLEMACCFSPRSWMREVLHPAVIAKAIIDFILRSWFSRIGVPALIIAFVLFYHMGNPTLDMIDQATASWWFIFIARQCLMLQLAIAIEYFIIDGLALRSRLAVNLFGPFLTLFIIDAKGWPFIVATWAMCDVILLEGDNAYQQNWLYFTDISIFSPANTGGRVLDSDRYIRVLVAMVLASLAEAIKRITVAMYFGKKTVRKWSLVEMYETFPALISQSERNEFIGVYKPRLEKISADIFIIAQVAELASEADQLAGVARRENETINEAATKRNLCGTMNEVKWGSIAKLDVLEESDDISQEGQADKSIDVADKPSAEDVENDSLTSSEGGDGNDDSNIDSDSDGDNESGFDKEVIADKKVSSRYSVASSKTTKTLKSLLDRWEEPMSKNETTDCSISDILSFRKRLSYMDKIYPFSPQFGPASTREDCIKSAKKTYRQLMKLDHRSSVLSFDVIGLLALRANGVEDEAKKLVLKRIFRPDRFGEIPLLAFVQACDSVYRRLRYFRASVGNSSVIDRVLEQVIDGLFYFVLILVTLSILDINPWKLLISLSSLIVSFAFAVGPSASKYIEGVLLIVARRPYDIGDRILIIGPENVMNYGVSYSWFVEDINLYSTTLRFASTNEVATVNNSSIAMSRIVNCNRSPSALVTLDLQFLDTATDEQLSIFREAIGKFVQDRPRIWDSVLFFRKDAINQNLDLMECTLRCRHTKSWQDAASILMNKSELLTFCFEMGKTLGINYDSPPRRQYVVNTFEPSSDASAALSDTMLVETPIQAPSYPFIPSDAAKALLLQAKGKRR